MKNLKDFGVKELTKKDSSEINGGGLIAWVLGFMTEVSKLPEQAAVNQAMIDFNK